MVNRIGKCSGPLLGQQLQKAAGTNSLYRAGIARSAPSRDIFGLAKYVTPFAQVVAVQFVQTGCSAGLLTWIKATTPSRDRLDIEIAPRSRSQLAPVASPSAAGVFVNARLHEAH